jgi:ectoine hydroxylase-related dioxygenase (phytanoyl-CoA dioxygenase family)
LSDEDASRAKVETAMDMNGPAGSVIAINCRTIHGSIANSTDRVRPLPLFVYSSADAFSWTSSPTPTSYSGDIVRGKPAAFVHMDPRPVQVPPRWEKVGYGSIFTAQKAG